MAENKIHRKTKSVKLGAPLKLPNRVVEEIVLREPTGAEYVRLGDPRVLVRSQTGSGYFVEQNEVIEKYLDACITDELGDSILNFLSLQDAMAVKVEMLSFFLEATARSVATS